MRTRRNDRPEPDQRSAVRTQRRRRRWGVLVAGVAGVSMLMPMDAAFAVNQYSLSGCKFNVSGNSLKWKDNTSRPSYATPAASSVGAWNSATTHLTMSKVTSGANLDVQDGNFGPLIEGQFWDAVTYWSCSGGYFTATSHSWWNRYYADGYTAPKRQSVMVHELGHGLGLAHYSAGSCLNVQIMQPDTPTRFDNCGYTAPRTGDVNGINVLY